MEKQDLKNLLENIYHLLEENLPILPTEPDPEEELQDRIPPDRKKGYMLRDTDETPTGPGLPYGPWDWGWMGPDGEMAEYWPPSIYPTQTTPPYGPGGFWVYNSSINSPNYGQRFYVYPPSHAYDEKTGTKGLFSAWWWDGKQFVEQVPAWGNYGGGFDGGGGTGGGGGV